jgi:hypothetical protein
MAAPSNRPGRVLPQDTAPGDAGEEVIAGEAVSLSEIDDLLYADDRPLELRIARLRELAAEVRARAAGEIGDDDARTLLSEMERTIGMLEDQRDRPGEPGFLAEDASAHRETLSPDSDELEAIEAADEASLAETDPLKDDDIRRRETGRRP